MDDSSWIRDAWMFGDSISGYGGSFIRYTVRENMKVKYIILSKAYIRKYTGMDVG